MSENESSREEQDETTGEALPAPDDAKPGFGAVAEQAKQDREEGDGPGEEPRVPFDEA